MTDTTDQQAVTVAHDITRNPESIWLSPICDDTAHHGEGRTWAAPAPDETCEDCSEPWVEYVRSDLASVSSASAETFLAQLRRVNSERYEAWITNPIMLCEHCGADASARSPVCKPPFDNQPHSFTRPHPYLTIRNDAGMMFDALELGGEVGELLNIVKKLEREERGWRGSRANPADFDDECADVLICLDKLARRRNVDLAAATIAKFNATSDKVGLPHRLAASPEPVPATNQAGEVERNLEAQRQAIEACARMCDRMVADKNLPDEAHNAAWNLAVGIRALRPKLSVATQPATSQEGGKSFASWSTDTLADQCRMQARDQLDPEFSSFLEEVADRLAATPTPPTLSEDLREALKPFADAAADYDYHDGQPAFDEYPDASSLPEINDLTIGNLRAARAALAQVKAS